MTHQLIYNIESVIERFKQLFLQDIPTEDRTTQEQDLFRNYLVHRLHIIHALPVHHAIQTESFDRVTDILQRDCYCHNYESIFRRGHLLDVIIRKAVPPNSVIFSGRQVTRCAIFNDMLIMELDT